MRALYFFHGKESGPFGRKYHRIKEQFPEVISPDFQGLELEARIAKAIEVTAQQSELTLVGSSMGGLVAARLYQIHPERIKNLILLAPALHTEASIQIQNMPAPEHVCVLHGYHDEVVPFQPIADFCQKFAIPYLAIADTHALGSHYAQSAMMAMIQKLYL